MVLLGRKSIKYLREESKHEGKEIVDMVPGMCALRAALCVSIRTQCRDFFFDCDY